MKAGADLLPADLHQDAAVAVDNGRQHPGQLPETGQQSRHRRQIENRSQLQVRLRRRGGRYHPHGIVVTAALLK